MHTFAVLLNFLLPRHQQRKMKNHQQRKMKNHQQRKIKSHQQRKTKSQRGKRWFQSLILHLASVEMSEFSCTNSASFCNLKALYSV